LRVAIAAIALVWQATGVATVPSQSQRWQRDIVMPHGGGQVCAVLDALVLAHAASRSFDDLRVMQQSAAGEAEMPFSLTESEAGPEEAEEATANHIKVRGNTLDFDLAMPRRVYSSVVLKMAAKNFVGRALVTAKDSGKVLGSFAIFDLSGEGLARSTTLALAETRLPEIHVALQLNGADGGTFQTTAAIVQGAKIPASREGQTLYTLVTATSSVQTTPSGMQVAEMTVPAHVPVERVRVVLDPSFQDEFDRDVRVAGVRQRSALKAEESVLGSIWRVSRPAGVQAESLGMDAVLGVTLRDAAKVRVEVDDVKDNRILSPLPIRQVRLEMRQRSVCFESVSGAKYVLRYGDARLAAPVYQQMNLQDDVMVTLGPEGVNPGFLPESDVSYRSPRRAGLAWIVGIGGLMLIWASAGSMIRRRGGRV
jgi:hypothetical protein